MATHDILAGPSGPVALELYSGIGGLRVSLEKAAAASRKAVVGDGAADKPAGETASFEINSVANSVSSLCSPESQHDLAPTYDDPTQSSARTWLGRSTCRFDSCVLFIRAPF